MMKRKINLILTGDEPSFPSMNCLEITLSKHLALWGRQRSYIKATLAPISGAAQVAAVICAARDPGNPKILLAGPSSLEAESRSREGCPAARFYFPIRPFSLEGRIILFHLGAFSVSAQDFAQA